MVECSDQGRHLNRQERRRRLNHHERRGRPYPRRTQQQIREQNRQRVINDCNCFAVIFEGYTQNFCSQQVFEGSFITMPNILKEFISGLFIKGIVINVLMNLPHVIDSRDFLIVSWDRTYPYHEQPLIEQSSPNMYEAIRLLQNDMSNLFEYLLSLHEENSGENDINFVIEELIRACDNVLDRLVDPTQRAYMNRIIDDLENFDPEDEDEDAEIYLSQVIHRFPWEVLARIVGQYTGVPVFPGDDVGVVHEFDMNALRVPMLEENVTNIVQFLRDMVDDLEHQDNRFNDDLFDFAERFVNKMNAYNRMFQSFIRSAPNRN